MNERVKKLLAGGAFACTSVSAVFAVAPANAATVSTPLSAARQVKQAYFGGMNGERILHWSGRVDDTVTVIIRGGDVRARDNAGKALQNVNIDQVNALPNVPGRVYLREWSGRGEVRIIEQPHARNNYTARVRIVDPQGGASHYSFTLGWRPL